MFLGENFVWWFGVVEDRADPLELGRVRVRCYGWHTEDKGQTPTENLPWAQSIQDITSAALGGIGKSATGLIEGSWVIGFFMDGNEAQRPVILGSLAGIPTNLTEGNVGFKDPTGTYPSAESFLQSDTPTLAKNNAEEDPTLIQKRKGKDLLGKVPTATAPTVSSVKPDRYDKTTYALDEKGEDTTEYWEEPNPRYGGETKDVYPEGVVSSGYPYNHVYRSESGHVFEVDDTPQAERLHRYHRKGTFEEIQPDGTRVTKVNGKNYEVVIDDENIYIQGNQNVTIKGNVKLYIQGDQYIEVDGNQFTTIRGDRVTKIQGNDFKEVITDENTQVNGDRNIRVSLNERQITELDRTETINQNRKLSVKLDENKVVGRKSSRVSGQSTTMIAGTNIDIASVAKTNIATGTEFNVTATGNATLDLKSSFRKQVLGSSHLTYGSTHYTKYAGTNTFTHEGDRKIYIKADTYARHDEGTDYSCSTDPARSANNNCSVPELPEAP